MALSAVMPTRSAMTLAFVLGTTAACIPVLEPQSEYGYVTDGIVVPTSSQMAKEEAFDVDGDGTLDNQIGAVIALLDIELQPYVDDYVNQGELILLHSILASNLENSRASWHMFLGEDLASPDFAGSGWFTVDAESPHDSILQGEISDRRLHVDAEQMELFFHLGAGEPMLYLHPLKVQIEATMYDDGCADGKIGGAITSWEVNEQIIPAIARILGTEPDKLRTNPVMQNLVAPDVDLFDGEELRPTQDGIADAVSFGLGITCVTASFDRPSE